HQLHTSSLPHRLPQASTLIPYTTLFRSIENIESLKEEGAQIIIASFHWGVERSNVPDETQVELAHSAIDHGADLVLGHHPHVLQDRKSTRLNSSHVSISYAVFCLKKKTS